MWLISVFLSPNFHSFRQATAKRFWRPLLLIDEMVNCDQFISYVSDTISVHITLTYVAELSVLHRLISFSPPAHDTTPCEVPPIVV